MEHTRPPVVLLHGFGQNRRCWGPLEAALEARRDVVAVDLPGHGAAGAVEADLWTTADLIGATIDPEVPAAVVGYSMGGRIGLHTALATPERVERLVLISATAGIDDDNERDTRRRSDEALAAHIEEVGVEQFVDEWLALPLFATLPSSSRYVDERRANSAHGLAMSLRRCGTGSQESLWSRLGELSMPVLVVAGALDHKFSALAERMVAGIGPNATLAIVGSAGHTVHLEQPAATADLITAFLDRP